MILRKPYPMPHLHDVLSQMQKFTFATVLDLAMAYYAFPLHSSSKEITTTIFPWGLYQHNFLPQGLAIGTDIVQAHLSLLFKDLSWVFVYLDDIIVVGNKTFMDHMQQIEKVLLRYMKKTYRSTLQKVFGPKIL